MHVCTIQQCPNYQNYYHKQTKSCAIQWAIISQCRFSYENNSQCECMDLKAKCKCTVINVVYCTANEETGYTYKDHAIRLNILTTMLFVGDDHINSNIRCGI